MRGLQLGQVDKVRLIKRVRLAVVAILVVAVLLVVGSRVMRSWKQRQARGLESAAQQLDVAGESLPTPAPTSTRVPPTPMPTATPAPTPFVHITAAMAPVLDGPGPIVVPLTLTVVRSDGAALGGALSARLRGDGYFSVGVGEWYTDGAGVVWEVTTEAAVDAFRGSGTLTWTLMQGERERALPLQWQVGQGVARAEDVLETDDVPVSVSGSGTE